jgi:uncharacterized membrane protein YgcG
MIIDLAVRGYVQIIEEKEKRPLIKDKVTYNLMLKNTDMSQLSPDEMLLISRIYPSRQQDEIANLSKRSSLYTTAVNLQKNVPKRLADMGYFRAGVTSKKGIFKGISAVIILSVAVILAISVVGSPVMWGFFAGLALGLPFYLAMDARTAKGVAAKEHLLGLKMYLEVAEKDRLEKLQSPSAPYAPATSEPVKTVELFEKLLPYAVVLGVEKEWAKQFESLYTSPPDWYSGNWGTFNAVVLASSISSGIGSAVGTSFSSPSSSSGSGFSGGGGFAGGGGGGGGGGGW